GRWRAGRPDLAARVLTLDVLTQGVLMSRYVAAVDQGTTSTRAMIFDHAGGVVAVDQREHEQIFPKAGWVEHDPEEIWENTRAVVAGALAKADLAASDIAAV